MSETHEFVVVVTGRDIIQAEFFKALLVGNDIPAIILDESGESVGMPMSILSHGVPVLVPDDMKAEAEKVIRDSAVSQEELERQAEEEAGEEGG